MNSGFFRLFRKVAAVHCMLVAALLLGGGFRSLFKKRDDPTKPVEFLVNLAPEQGPDTEPPPGLDLLKEIPLPPAPAPEPEPEPEPPAPPAPAPEPKPSPKEVPAKKPEKKQEKKAEKPAEKKPATKPGKKPVEPSRKKVIRPVGVGSKPSDSPRWASSERRLSDADIRRLLAMGAKGGSRTVVPGEDIRCYSRIREVMYDAWTQPSAAEAGNAEVLATLTFRTDGTIVGRELTRRSGNAALDASVEQALNAVQRISGLTMSFLGDHETVTISFKVEQE